MHILPKKYTYFQGSIVLEKYTFFKGSIVLEKYSYFQGSIVLEKYTYFQGSTHTSRAIHTLPGKYKCFLLSMVVHLLMAYISRIYIL